LPEKLNLVDNGLSPGHALFLAKIFSDGTELTHN